MIDPHKLKRQLRAIHNDLRSQGLNPMQAISQVVTDVVENGSPTFSGVAPSDLLSSIYQEFLVAEARNGFGQYLTPLPVADFVAGLVKNASRNASILDPFSGSGLLLERVAQVAKVKRLTGIEINGLVADVARNLSRLAPSPIDVIESDAFQSYIKGELPKADVVVANPPFGAMVTDIENAKQHIPEALTDLGQIPAELFGLEVCVAALKPGGTLAIVLPQSILTNRRWAAFRAHILSQLQLHATISLPGETFSPFRGVATACVLFGRKAGVSPAQTIKHWTSKSVGYTDTGRVSPIENDLPAIAEAIASDQPSQKHLCTTELGDASFTRAEVEGQVETPLAQFADVFIGKNPPASAYGTSGAWLLKVGDLAGSMVSWRTRKKNRVSTEWFAKYERLHLQPGDICLTAAGHKARYIGLKVDLLDYVPPEGAIASGEVMVIRLHQSSSIQPEQLLFYLRSATGYEKIQDLVRGSTGHLYAADLGTIQIPQLHETEYASQLVKLYKSAAQAYREYRDFEIEANQLAGVSPLTEADS